METQSFKQNKTLRAGSVLFIVALITLIALSFTFAKYVSQGSGSDNARVAKWGVNIPINEDLQLFSSAYKGYDPTDPSDQSATVRSNDGKERVIAPGTSNDVDVILISENKPEVMYDFNVDLKILDNGEAAQQSLIDLLDGYKPWNWTLNGVKYNKFNEFIKAVNDLGQKDVPPNQLPSTTKINIGWVWDFDDSGTGTYDTSDTYLGNEAVKDALTHMQVILKVDAVQCQGCSPTPTPLDPKIVVPSGTVNIDAGQTIVLGSDQISKQSPANWNTPIVGDSDAVSAEWTNANDKLKITAKDVTDAKDTTITVSVDKSGQYDKGEATFNVHVNAKKVETLSVIGDMTGWGSDIDLEYDKTLDLYHGVVSPSPDTEDNSWKIRKDHDWYDNWGLHNEEKIDYDSQGRGYCKGYHDGGSSNINPPYHDKDFHVYVKFIDLENVYIGVNMHPVIPEYVNLSGTVVEQSANGGMDGAQVTFGKASDTTRDGGKFNLKVEKGTTDSLKVTKDGYKTYTSNPMTVNADVKIEQPIPIEQKTSWEISFNPSNLTFDYSDQAETKAFTAATCAGATIEYSIDSQSNFTDDDSLGKFFEPVLNIFNDPNGNFTINDTRLNRITKSASLPVKSYQVKLKATALGDDSHNETSVTKDITIEVKKPSIKEDSAYWSANDYPISDSLPAGSKIVTGSKTGTQQYTLENKDYVKCDESKKTFDNTRKYTQRLKFSNKEKGGLTIVNDYKQPIKEFTFDIMSSNSSQIRTLVLKEDKDSGKTYEFDISVPSPPTSLKVIPGTTVDKNNNLVDSEFGNGCPVRIYSSQDQINLYGLIVDFGEVS